MPGDEWGLTVVGSWGRKLGKKAVVRNTSGRSITPYDWLEKLLLLIRVAETTSRFNSENSATLKDLNGY